MTSRSIRHVACPGPAHNVQQSIAACIHSLQNCTTQDIELVIVVVAENCTDRTVAEALDAAAVVLEYNDGANRGMGYALHFAFTQRWNSDFGAFLVLIGDLTIPPSGVFLRFL